ncbi:MAG: extensin family protein [Pseudomonadota bacterium]
MRALALSLMLVAGFAAAAPESSKRPIARAGTDARNVSVVRTAAVQSVAASVASSLPAAAVLPESAVSLRPSLRPEAVVQKAMARRNARRRGQVCGDPDLQGDTVGFVPGRINGCGISEAVRLRSVSGVTLSQSALMDCTTAKALKRWTEKGAKPALRGTGGGLASYRVAAHYACRTRNNQPGARISEHGKGRAIDISGFQLKDGTSLTVLNDWNSRHRRALRRMHKAACGPFGTVLGPNSDRFHRDHFHFDTARHRGGAYCR